MQDRFTFGKLCQLLDELMERKGSEKRQRLKEFFAWWRARASDDAAVSGRERGREKEGEGERERWESKNKHRKRKERERKRKDNE